MTTLIIAMAVTSLLLIAGMGAVLLALKAVLNRLEEQAICINIVEAQMKKGLNCHKVTNEEIVHAFDDYFTSEGQKKMIVTSSNYEKYRKVYCQYMYIYFEDYISLECDYCDIRGKCEEPTKEHIEKLNKWVENHMDFVNSNKHLLKSEGQEE